MVDRYAAQGTSSDFISGKGKGGSSPSTERISFEEMRDHLYIVDRDK